MTIKTIAHRAALLRADLAMLPTVESLALAARTPDADGPLGDAARDLHGIRVHLNALFAEQDETLTLYRTTDGRVFDSPGQADDHSAHLDDRGLDVLSVRVTSVRPIGERPAEPAG